MPLAARITIIGGVTVFCTGAVYLMATRGSAILIDLSTTAARVFCL